MNFKIKSISGRIHDTGYGGYPYKIIVIVEVASEYYNKLPKFTTRTFFGTKIRRDVGLLVLDVNNAVYKHNHNIPVQNLSIDSKGEKKAKNGVKTMEFVYFFNDHDKAEKLGFNLVRTKRGEVFPSFNNSIEIL